MSFGDKIAPSGGGSYSSYFFNDLLPKNARDAFFIEGIDKSTGRTIYRPNKPMRRVQAEFKAFLDGLHYTMPHAHNILGRSIATNAAAHRGNWHFFLMDMRGAYPSTPLEATARELVMAMAFSGPEYLDRMKDYDYAMPRVYEWLRDWCFLPEGGLITGAASAPMLFNLFAASHFDSRLEPFLKAEGITYTRYMDDLTFSSSGPITRPQRTHIRAVLAEAGLQESHHKTKVGLNITKGPIEITGVMLDQDGRVFPGKDKRNRATGMMAAAFAGKINPPVAHGHAGSCFQALAGGRADRMSHPSVKRVRTDQVRLLQERPFRSDS